MFLLSDDNRTFVVTTLTSDIMNNNFCYKRFHVALFNIQSTLNYH